MSRLYIDIESKRVFTSPVLDKQEVIPQSVLNHGREKLFVVAWSAWYDEINVLSALRKFDALSLHKTELVYLMRLSIAERLNVLNEGRGATRTNTMN